MAAQQGFGFFGEVPQIVRMNGAEPGLQFVLILAQAGMDLPAIAARCGKGHALRFQDNGFRPGFGEF